MTIWGFIFPRERYINVFAKKTKALKDLTIASLISKGYVMFARQKPKKLYVPFEKDKAYYLYNFLVDNDLGKFVKVELKQEEFMIYLTDELSQLTQEWYINGEKLFNKEIAIKYLNFQNVIISINLFGHRNIEGIGLPTTIKQDYLKTLTYFMGKIIDTTVLIGNNQLRVPLVTELYLNIIVRVSTNDSSLYATYLTNQEKKTLRGIKEKDGGPYV